MVLFPLAEPGEAVAVEEAVAATAMRKGLTIPTLQIVSGGVVKHCCLALKAHVHVRGAVSPVAPRMVVTQDECRQ